MQKYMLHPRWSHIFMPPNLFYLQSDQTTPRLPRGRWMSRCAPWPFIPHGDSLGVCGWTPVGEIYYGAAQKHGEKSDVMPSVFPFCFGLEDSVNLWSQELL